MTTSQERKAYMKAYREKNRERLLTKQRERSRAHYLANKDAYAQRSQAWREANPDRYLKATRAHAQKNREVMLARSKAWYAENKDRASATRRRNKLANYGLTLEQFSQLLETQAGACLICLDLMNQPVVDHCHASGAVRGLLCRKCNAALGLLKDSQEVLLRAAEYLTRSLSGATSTPSRKP